MGGAGCVEGASGFELSLGVNERGVQPAISLSLSQEFKFWRFRLMLVPDLFKGETRKLTEAPPSAPCGIYHQMTLEEQQVAVVLKFFFKGAPTPCCDVTGASL